MWKPGKNKNINFDLDTGKLLYAKDPTDYLVNTDPWDFGPRLGIAYQIIPQKLVLRGGYGIFYSGEDMSGSNVNLPLNPPQLIPVTMVRTANGPPVLKVSAAPPSNLFDTYNTTIVSLRAREKDYKSAIDGFDKFLTAFPDNGSAYLLRGMAKLNTKDSPGACADFQKALSFGNKDAQETINEFCK